MRAAIAVLTVLITAPADGLGQVPNGQLLWSMDSVYVLATVDDALGITTRRALSNQVRFALEADGLVVTEAATPTVVVRTTVRGSAAGDDGYQLLLEVALTDNVTRIKYVDAALTRCMSADGCRRNVEGARALGSWGILWQDRWLGYATSREAAAAAIEKRLTGLVTALLAAHAAANHR